ncbi:hypothetical protein HNY73_013060 [Argiope bruennichi]|uniref:Uncharacterized protein n=1 Tax=Argiope bruennichi TaxID=94029 RepID=A0A8T0EYR0_ARGBR|nr:hypothetical protein HNY73_013060 [Argiope bruennichi]
MDRNGKRRITLRFSTKRISFKGYFRLIFSNHCEKGSADENGNFILKTFKFLAIGVVRFKWDPDKFCDVHEDLELDGISKSCILPVYEPSEIFN